MRKYKLKLTLEHIFKESVGSISVERKMIFDPDETELDEIVCQMADSLDKSDKSL